MMKKFTVMALLILVPTLASGAQTLKQGSFSCESYGSYDPTSLQVKQHPTKPNKVILNWQGKDRIVHLEQTSSGALRYEGAVSKIIYIQTPHHSTVLNNQNMRVILSDCRHVTR